MKVCIRVLPVTGRTAARCFFLLAAMVCLGIYSGVFLEREWYQNSESRAFDQMAAAALVSAQNPVGPAVMDRGRKLARPSKAVPESALIGRLSVQRLHLQVMVREGVDRHTLLVAAGHIPATPLPGQAGNVGVAGHRDTFFRGLKDVETGDEIRFSTLDGDFRYMVESLRIVEPDQVSVLAASAQNVLTLVTCYPFSYVGNAPKRFIVRARQVSPPMAPPPIVE